jgi:hypothetical protein
VEYVEIAEEEDASLMGFFSYMVSGSADEVENPSVVTPAPVTPPLIKAVSPEAPTPKLSLPTPVAATPVYQPTPLTSPGMPSLLGIFSESARPVSDEESIEEESGGFIEELLDSPISKSPGRVLSGLFPFFSSDIVLSPPPGKTIETVSFPEDHEPRKQPAVCPTCGQHIVGT